ncbi:MAG: hypothetical protein IT329_23655 [Caldilineaceae bacterium]|nr:hypothetical protein [Caldilineaceae bacterium]
MHPRVAAHPIRILLAIFALLAATYSVITPPFETPDEIWHYAVIQQIAGGQGLPVSGPNTDAAWQQEGTQGPLYYLLAASATVWIDQSDFPAIYARANPHAAPGRPDTLINRNIQIHHAGEQWPWRGPFLALHLARFVSVALGMVTVWAVYRTITLILGPGWGLTAAAAIAFIPQFLFISAAASNDNAVSAFAGLTLWQVTALALAPAAALTPAGLRRRFVLIGVMLGLALIGKLSALPLVGVVGLAALAAAWRARSWRILPAAALWIGLPAALLSGWWFARNWLLYGDLLAWNVWEANIPLRVEPLSWRGLLAELGSVERSFWGLFGWMTVPYPPWVYAGFRALLGLVVIGWLFGLVRWVRGGRGLDRRAWAGALLLVWLALLTVAWVRFTRVSPASQGRLFFPAMPTVALLLALGLGGWRVPALGPLAAGGLFLLSSVTPFWIIAPAYRAPAPVATLPADLTSVNAQVGDAIALRGIAAAPVTLTPGAGTTITVAWQTLGPVDRDYSVFVHLVDADGLVAAQLDTMPGGGLAPTSQWQPGELRVEGYTVTLPPTAYTPNTGQWAVGLYDAYRPDSPRLPLVLISPDDLAASVEGDALRFGQVTMVPPPGETPNPIDIAFADNVTLAGYTFNRRRLYPGDTLEVTLYWRVRGPVAAGYTTFVHLLDADFAMFGGSDSAPDPPTPAWIPGEIVEDRHTFALPADTPPGSYQVELGLYTQPDFDRLTLLDPGRAEGADRLLLGPLEVGAGAPE